MTDVSMAYSIEWYIPKRVVLLRYHVTEITPEILNKVGEDLERYYQEGESPIHIISDQTQLTKISLDMQDLKQDLAIMKERNWGWAMLIGSNSLANFFVVLLGNTFGFKIRIVKSVEEAGASLKRLDLSLSEIIDK